jgi:transposase
MAAYSLDLRTRIVDALERGLGTRSEVATVFDVHESFVYKLLRQKRQRGDLAPLPHGGGAEAKLNEDQLLLLADLAPKSPDATLEQLRVQIKKQARVELSVPTIWRALDALGLSRKKVCSSRRSGPGGTGRIPKKARKTARYPIDAARGQYLSSPQGG